MQTDQATGSIAHAKDRLLVQQSLLMQNKKHFPTASTMALGRAFNACVKEVKTVLQQNFVEVSIYSSYLHVALCSKEAIQRSTNNVGVLSTKGRKKCTGKSFALFEGQSFLKEFEGLNRADTAK